MCECDCFADDYMIKTVIFDLDGTITNSEYLSYELMREEFKKMGYELSFSQAKNTFGVSETEAGQYLSASFPGVDGEKLLAEKMPVLMNGAILAGRLKRKPGFDQLLKYLNDNHINTAVASNNSGIMVNMELEGTGLKTSFDKVMWSDMVERAKPFPDMYDAIRDEFKCHTHECLVIEDSQAGLLAAKNGGYPAVLVRDVCPITVEMEEYSLAVFDTLDEIIPLIEEGKYA